MLFESHSHTPLCKHATGDPVEYAAVAESRGLSGLHVTCHNPMPDGFSSNVRMGLDEFDEYVDLVAKATDEFRGRVDVCLGLEADYFEGYEAFLEKQLGSADFHFVLGSVHPQIAEWRKKYWEDDLTEVQRTYFNLLAKTAETGMFDSVSHPDLIKNFTKEAWDTSVALEFIRPALDRIAATGVAMELNTSGVLKRISEMNPFPDMLREMNLRGIPVTLGADAHVPERVGDGYITAMGLLKDAGYEEVRYFKNRKPINVSIDAAIESLETDSANV
ncbi:histidinol-phosphatase HisJ family protein [Roseiconus lacunae]|uniref:Histidinol-phosphatase n=1 Tax=Roseiconus lacunae TaxID=2605694 RepID=A0ABT7PMA9_9BACT|nr:histidinol-phosphatase HisJ family protein [Roseiconus lacunae]MCD0461556.1 histidinol-phosphatase HisJ family protein [Roseiconus lacunae]MDM4017634.1 histidinol-phosphatase HisJ family protein [Roseiconus lacunae]WRQ51104.1 histidinol-phosphatase HisJ family protein [Stieleria sp. HD01]